MRTNYFRQVRSRYCTRIAALDKFDDPQTAAAVADTVFREGRQGGAKLLATAANSVLNKLDPAFSSGLGLSNLPDPDSVGPQTLNTLVTLSNAGFGLQL